MTYTSLSRNRIALACIMTASMPAVGAPPASPTSPARLDLRPPAAGDLAPFKAANDLLTGRFPLGERFAGRSSTADDHREFQVPDATPNTPPLLARAEGLAQRFRREGLPVARLWENHSAFISVGLSPRGKPGIWLIQKTR